MCRECQRLRAENAGLLRYIKNRQEWMWRLFNEAFDARKESTLLRRQLAALQGKEVPRKRRVRRTKRTLEAPGS